MFDIHDNEIISYEVDLYNRKIIIHTQKTGSTNVEMTNIIFSDVFAHNFEHGLHGSIIFDIDIYDLPLFIKHNNELLIKHKEYGWPIDYVSVEELLEILSRDQYVYYVISSSYGLEGWVLAKEYDIKNT